MRSQQISYYDQQGCIFCPQEQGQQSSDLFQMMNQALSTKYSNQSNNHLILPIDILLKIQQAATTAQLQDYITYKELTYVDDNQQRLIIMYGSEKWNQQIQERTEYFKFHKDTPHIIERGIERILREYYSKKRQYDYKCIKKQLKEEQGVSITSVQETITENSQTIVQKSKYSTLLNALNENEDRGNPLMSDSNLLVEICKEIGKALPRTKVSDNDFQGIFYDGDKNFDSYIKNMQMKNKKIFKASTIEQHFKKKSKNIYTHTHKGGFNYFNFERKKNYGENSDITRNKNETKIKSKKVQRQKEEKKRFVYNTNIKIQIQNALFYPNQHHKYANYGTGSKQFSNFNTAEKIAKSRKSLVGKITNALNEDRYRTPLTKIYQLQEAEFSTRYGKRTSTNKKQKVKTKNSRDYKDFKQFKQFHEDREKQRSKQKEKQRERSKEKQREFVYPKRVMSHHNLRRATLQPHQENFMDRHINNGTISTTKLRYDNQNERRDTRNRGSSLRRGSSLQSIKRRSVTLNKNKESQEKIPISKYSSSQIKDNKFKGISIKDLLSKKMNIYQR